MKWVCNSCGFCCKFFKIEIDMEDAEKIKNLGYDYKNFLVLRDNPCLKKNRNGCIFLQKNNKCSIQTKHGYENKPKICRKFPYDKNGSPSLVCGTFSHSKEKLKTPFFRKEKIFVYKGKVISTDSLISLMEKIDFSFPENSWYNLLKDIKNLKKGVVEKKDVNMFVPKTEKIPFREKTKLHLMLSNYSKFVFPEYFLSSIKKHSISLNFKWRKISLDYKKIKNIEIDVKEKKRFIDMIKNGYGIVYNKNYPQHLLFCLYFLDDFSKIFAYEREKKIADVYDFMNAYTILNSPIKFS